MRDFSSPTAVIVQDDSGIPIAAFSISAKWLLRFRQLCRSDRSHCCHCYAAAAGLYQQSNLGATRARGIGRTALEPVSQWISSSSPTRRGPKRSPLRGRAAASCAHARRANNPAAQSHTPSSPRCHLQPAMRPSGPWQSSVLSRCSLARLRKTRTHSCRSRSNPPSGQLHSKMR